MLHSELKCSLKTLRSVDEFMHNNYQPVVKCSNIHTVQTSSRLNETYVHINNTHRVGYQKEASRLLILSSTNKALHALKAHNLSYYS